MKAELTISTYKDLCTVLAGFSDGTQVVDIHPLELKRGEFDRALFVSPDKQETLLIYTGPVIDLWHDNRQFNDCILAFAASRMVAAGYAEDEAEATSWLWGRGTEPRFRQQNNSFSERGAVATLTRLCEHAYHIILARRGEREEIVLPKRVKRYYIPLFTERLARGLMVLSPAPRPVQEQVYSSAIDRDIELHGYRTKDGE